MSYATMQAQIVSVIEAVTPATTRRNKAAFKHAPTTSEDKGPNPASRGFYIVPRAISFAGANNASGIAARMHAELDLFVFYVEDKEVAQNFEDIAADARSIGRALLAPSARGTYSTTSIVGIGLANDAIMRAQIEKVDGGYRSRTPFVVEYTG